MSTPVPTEQQRRDTGDHKKSTSSSFILTRNGARNAKIQTRAMVVGSKPSILVVNAKRKKSHQKKKQVIDSEVRDHLQFTMELKTKVKGPTGFVTEPRMVEHRCLWDKDHPECPERLTSVLDRCRELNLIEQCKQYQPRAASKEELLSIHSPLVFEILESTHLNNDEGFLEETSSKFDAIYFHPSTHELALIAAGSTVDMVEHVLSGDVQNGVAFVRPPGHHAMLEEPCGYCFYNNVALAARHALDRGLNRILIVDWDVHHGQATQQMFYDDNRVVYFSIHRYEQGSFWPNLRQSDYNYIGHGQGKGYNFNVPLNEIGMRDADYLAIWHQLLLPMALEYQPELIIVSAGYDAAIGCPEYVPDLIIVSAGFDSALGDEKGEMEVSPACYASLVHMLMCVCPSVCVVLEGGYCLPSLAESAALTLRTLLGHPPPQLHETGEPSNSIRESILNCIYVHKPYWHCFNYQQTYSIDGIPNVCDGEKEKHIVTHIWRGDETRPDRFPTRDWYPKQDSETKKQFIERLNHLRTVTVLPSPQHAVCYIYDEAMLKHKNVCEPYHEECPERISRIHQQHQDFGLLDRLHILPARAATDSEILAVHTEKHLNILKEFSSTKLKQLNHQKKEYDSVYFHPDSFESAAVAMGCVLQAVDAVLSNVAGSGVCVVRPPGHHASEELPSGFCLLNNAAGAAKYALLTYGLSRVLIVDWDVHHGNGTQRITFKDNKILYISVHLYEHGKFFPNSPDGDYCATGEGLGEGYNVNIPWNKRGMGDVEYLAAFTNVVLPVAYEYNPELVIVSAGFDACAGDPLGGCKVSPQCFGKLTQMLRGLAGGKVVLCLEGGYNISSISCAMSMCTKALLGDPIQFHYNPTTKCHWSAVESINNVIKTHKKYWKSLKFQLALPIENILEEPLPSRGLITDPTNPKSTQNTPLLSSSMPLSNESIVTGMMNLNIDKKKCTDGTHCGTDDENGEESKVAGNGQKQNSSRVEDSAGSSSGATEKQGSHKDGEQKQTLVDFLSENLHDLVKGKMFTVVPEPWCPHLDTLFAIPESVKFEQGVKCIECDEKNENWVCLHCYVTACSRCVNGHMQEHYRATEHALVLSLLDLSVWCNVCDAYVDNALLYDAKNNAHKYKFGEDMPWCYRTDLHME